MPADRSVSPNQRNVIAGILKSSVYQFECKSRLTGSRLAAQQQAHAALCKRSGVERESPLIASDKSLGDVSFDCRGQSCGFTSLDARVIPAEEYSVAEHHCLDRNILLLAAVVRNTK
jgi:hypothetical protein